jgi:hypothetical protein
MAACYQCDVMLGIGWSLRCPTLHRICVYHAVHFYKIQEIKTWKEIVGSRLSAVRCPPPQNVWKWNVDGSSKGKPGAAGIGDEADVCNINCFKRLK